MATEKYGVSAQLVKSIATTPVSTNTVVIFIGASASGTLNKPYLITSMSDYAARLGGAPGDGYNLSEAAVAAFSMAGISQVYMIPVSHDMDFDAEDYLGDAAEETGVYAVISLLRENPSTVNILCAPGIEDGSVIAALLTVAKKADGHWDSFVYVDCAIPSDAVSNGVFFDPDEVTKNVNDERAVQCLGKVKTTGDYWVSLAAVRACLQAASDAGYGVPARSGGNLAIPGAVAWGDNYALEEITCTCAAGGESDGYKPKFTLTQTGYTTYSGQLRCGCTISSSSEGYPKTVSGFVTFSNGVGVLTDGPSLENVTSPSFSAVFAELWGMGVVSISEAMATQLSADGVCAVINYGGGNWHTWGDHTAAFSAGSVSDERARYDSNIRLLLMLTNRFQLKYRFDIDNPMTLTVRNDIIQEENDYLAYLKSIGALIGEASCSFKADDNPSDNIAQGQFVWSIEATNTPPMKYAQLNVAFSQAGYSVYYEA